MAETPSDLDLVRAQVKQILGDSAGWKSLDPGERRAFAQNMVKVAHFLARDPGWLDVPDPPAAAALAEGLAGRSKDPISDLKGRLAQKPGQVDFQANAMKQGVQEFGNLVKTVDFPEFVSGLIHGVFQAIVDASIQQMQAYGELLAATAKTVGQFAQDHISDDQAREQVATRYPSLVRVERNPQGGTRLVQQEGADDMSALQQMTGRRERVSIDEPESEQKLVLSAKLEMARQRQKMMALMVMLGINRIIVTNGKINAKVVFDIDTSDYAKRKASAGLTDTAESESGGVATAAFPWGGAAGYTRSKHKTTVRSSVDDNSESSAKMKAQLTGEVNVNFRSETLPPERMLDALQFDQINHMSQAGPPAAPAAQPSQPERRPA
jgi:hypothetical protein